MSPGGQASLVLAMFDKPNLLITYDPQAEASSEAEARRLLDHAGTKKAKFRSSGVEGLFEVTVDGDAKQTVRRLSALCMEHPAWFMHTHRWIPIESWGKSDAKQLERSVAKAAEGIRENEAWALKVVKRHYPAPSPELIADLARFVHAPRVDLRNPDKIVRVEIVEGRAGVSLLQRGDWLHVTPVKGMAGPEPEM
jgi:tRNA(Ser,Leu) C12 N-acetylase TAN1